MTLHVLLKKGSTLGFSLAGATVVNCLKSVTRGLYFTGRVYMKFGLSFLLFATLSEVSVELTICMNFCLLSVKTRTYS